MCVVDVCDNMCVYKSMYYFDCSNTNGLPQSMLQQYISIYKYAHTFWHFVESNSMPQNSERTVS